MKTKLDDTMANKPELTTGAIVHARGSMWAATEVALDTEDPDSPHHVVTLQCLDEDRMGHEIQVVWEHEIGATLAHPRVIPSEIHRDGYRAPDMIGACVDAVRWGAVTSADPSQYQSPFRAGINVEGYQLEPLRRALSAPRVNLLLADDVGLGKTIEAGLVLQELVLRHQVTTAIIVCPPSLALKWQQEMRDRFGVSFVIVDSACLNEVRRTHGPHANPLVVFPRVIVSMSWLASPRAQRLLRPVLAESSLPDSSDYVFDMLIVDEAHHVAPSNPTEKSSGRGYAVDSQRTTRTRELAERCEHRLFLSATPHNGHTESFTALLEMIDSRRFVRGMTPTVEEIQEVTVRRLKTDIVEKGFKKRELKSIEFTPKPDEVAHFEILHQMLVDAKRRLKGHRSVGFFGSLIKKRFLSSPWSFHETWQAYAESKSNREPHLSDGYIYEVLGEGQDDLEEGLADQPEAEAIRSLKGSKVLAGASEKDVQSLATWSAGFQAQPDARLEALCAFLDSVCRKGKAWTDERVVVFTEYRHTLEWIQRYLASQGYVGDRIAAIHGGVGSEERELIRDSFTSHPSKDPLRVLLATDAAGEGIDLQDYCHRLVNFDLPFNPSRLEQRIGRIDRYGQKQVPEVFMFEAQGTSSMLSAQTNLVTRVSEKMATVRSDLGSANEVLSSRKVADDRAEVSMAIQEALNVDGLPEAESAVKSAVKGRKSERGSSGEAVDVVDSALTGSRKLNAELSRLMRGYEKRARELNVSPTACQRALDYALKFSNEPLLTVVDDFDDVHDGLVYKLPKFGHSWSEACAGLDTLKNPGVLRPITFDKELAAGNRDVVHIHMGHALLQRAARVLRAQVSDASTSGLYTVTPSGVVDSSCVVAVTRVVMLGRGGLRLHEEVVASGVRLRGQQLARPKAEAALAAALNSDLTGAEDRVIDRVRQAWNGNESNLRDRLSARVESGVAEAMELIKTTLKDRKDADLQRVQEIFDSARQSLRETRDALSGEAKGQQELWTDQEQKQRDLDLQRVLEKLNSVDARNEAELNQVRRRYADLKVESFPVALVFVVTPEDAEKWDQ